MKTLDRQGLAEFANQQIVRFHAARLARLEKLSLNRVLKKKESRYLFGAKNVTTAGELVHAILNAFLSFCEEKMFGDFLEQLAIFVSAQTDGGRKSSAAGVNLDFDRCGTRYLVSIKSVPNWGNSCQYSALEAHFRNAIAVQRQAHHTLRIQAVLGICYGKTMTADKGLYVRYTGQSFWHFLSGDPSLYLDVINPIGCRASEHNDDFDDRKAALVNRFTAQFIDTFCDSSCAIDWVALVEFNSGNYDLDKFLS